MGTGGGGSATGGAGTGGAGTGGAGTVNVQVTASWAQYYVTFSQLTQLGWGRPAAFDLAHSMWIQFHDSPVIGTLTNPASFDLWIDDIEFVP